MATRKVRKTDPQSRVTALILDQIMGLKLSKEEELRWLGNELQEKYVRRLRKTN